MSQTPIGLYDIVLLDWSADEAARVFSINCECHRGVMAFVGYAQQAMPIIGFLNVATQEGYASNLAAFHEGLKESGYEEGRNVSIEYRWADGHCDRLSELATELVHRQVAVIVANTPANVPGRDETK